MGKDVENLWMPLKFHTPQSCLLTSGIIPKRCARNSSLRTVEFASSWTQSMAIIGVSAIITRRIELATLKSVSSMLNFTNSSLSSRICTYVQWNMKLISVLFLIVVRLSHKTWHLWYEHWVSVKYIFNKC